MCVFFAGYVRVYNLLMCDLNANLLRLKEIANFWLYVFPTYGLYNHHDVWKTSDINNNWTDLSGRNASVEHGILMRTDWNTSDHNGGSLRTGPSANLQISHIQQFGLTIGTVLKKLLPVAL